MLSRFSLCAIALAIFSMSALRAELTAEQRKMVLEADAPDHSRAKIILLAGQPSNKPGQHEYFAGCALMMAWLRTVPGVWPVLVADGWPKNEAIFNGAKCVVSYMDGGVKMAFLEPARWEQMKKLAADGAGLVVLHQGIDCPEDHAAEFQQWFGAVFAKDIGCRGHWDVKFESVPMHAVTTGMKPFELIKDGWLYNLHFAATGVTPLLRCRTSHAQPTMPNRTPAAARPSRGHSTVRVVVAVSASRAAIFTRTGGSMRSEGSS